jgi:uncharacterized phage protein (TIGR02216 family)
MGLAPESFWRLSLTEWQAIAEGYAMRLGKPQAPLSRVELAAMAARFPDKEQAP